MTLQYIRVVDGRKSSQNKCVPDKTNILKGLRFKVYIFKLKETLSGMFRYNLNGISAFCIRLASNMYKYYVFTFLSSLHLKAGL